MATQPLMKEGLGAAAIERIIHGLRAAGADFCETSFRRDALDGLELLELKQRVHHLVEVIAKHLPAAFEKAAVILGNVQAGWDEGDPEDNLRSFAAWPIIDYVAEYGIDHPAIALPLLRRLTSMFSAEFAIRAFLNRYPEMTYNEMLFWCMDSNEHVRRLASEGIRPRLPWGGQLRQYIEDPAPVITLLDSLVDDPSDYVRRSVANNLNDISKDHPALVIETCQRWMAEKIPARKWIVQRATRSLVKQGHPKVFPLLGYTRRPQLILTPLTLAAPELTLGESLQLATTIVSTASIEQNMVIDYAIHFVKASGRTAAKVFKWKNLRLSPGQKVLLHKNHLIKPITTRSYYPGVHEVELLINGKSKGRVSFELFTNSAN